jgi:hypothetical protein
MAPLKKLRKAIEEKSWALAIEAYTALTGEEIGEPEPEPPEPPRKRGRPAKKAVPPAKPKPKTKGRKVEESPAVLSNGRPNGFFDDGAIDPDLRIVNNPALGGKVVQPRPAVRYVDVTCSVCGKHEKVSPKLKPQRIGDTSDGDDTICQYKCNRCITGR